jgi:hypothetical protein
VIKLGFNYTPLHYTGRRRTFIREFYGLQNVCRMITRTAVVDESIVARIPYCFEIYWFFTRSPTGMGHFFTRSRQTEMESTTLPGMSVRIVFSPMVTKLSPGTLICQRQNETKKTRRNNKLCLKKGSQHINQTCRVFQIFRLKYICY